jgi:hypothetical protein
MQTAEKSAAVRKEGIGEICGRVALEIELVRNMAARLELSLCVMTASGSIDEERVRDLQQIDLMQQHLAALRDFLGELSKLPNVRGPIELVSALDRVLIDDLKRRLEGADAPDHPPGPRAGDVELL